MNHRPRKRLGQHFLHDRNIIRRIIEEIAPHETSPVVEIGPGPGALTIPLLKLVSELDVIEVDRDLAGELEFTCRELGNLNIHVADALEIDFCKLKPGKLIIVGNLPYNISTPLLFHLLTQVNCIKYMLFMMQLEVVNRICAMPGTKEYGRLSVMVQSVCNVKKAFNIPPGAFKPPPKVESSLIRLVPDNHRTSRINNRTIFSDIVKQAFNHRRKTIRNSLNGIVDKPVLEQAGVNPALRAENLSVEDFIRLANLQNSSGI